MDISASHHSGRREEKSQGEVARRAAPMTTDEWSARVGDDPSDPDFRGGDVRVQRWVPTSDVNAFLRRDDLLRFILKRHGLGVSGKNDNGKFWCPTCCGHKAFRGGRKPSLAVGLRPTTRKAKAHGGGHVEFKFDAAVWMCGWCKKNRPGSVWSGDIITMAAILGEGDGSSPSRPGGKFQRSIARLRMWDKAHKASGGNLSQELNPRERIKWLRFNARGLFLHPVNSRAVFACFCDIASGREPPTSAADLCSRVRNIMHQEPTKNQTIIYNTVNRFFKDFGAAAAPIYRYAASGGRKHEIDRQVGRLVGDWLDDNKSVGRRHARTRGTLEMFYRCYYDKTPTAEKIMSAVNICLDTARSILDLLKAVGLIGFPHFAGRMVGGWRIRICHDIGRQLEQELSFLRERGRGPPLWLRHLVFKLCGIPPQGELPFVDESKTWRERALDLISSARMRSRAEALSAQLAGAMRLSVGGDMVLADGER